MTSIIKVDELQTKAGAAHTLHGLGVTGSGTVLQEIYGFCDGRTVSGITFPDVTATQALTTSHADITGSEISYTPPTGTKTVVYTFNFKWHSDQQSGISHFAFYIDSDEVSSFRRTIASAFDANHHATLTFTFDYPILIDSSLASDEPANAKFKSWTSAKTFKLTGREYGSGYQSTVHKNGWWNGASATGQNNIDTPRISIKAIS